MFDEPLADPSQIPTYLVSKLARQHVTVALTGDGGDELFAGYNRYVSGEGLISNAGGLKRGARHLAGAALTTVSEDMWDRVHRLSSPLLPRSARVRLAGAKLQKIGRVLLEDSEGAQYRSLVSFWREPGTLLSNRGGNGDPFLERFSQHEHLPLLGRMQLIDQKQYLPDDLLAKVDRASMAVSLEARVPLLDHRLVEFSWRLPRRYKIRHGQGKWLLKHALYKRVPRELVDRPKVGFTIPTREWLMGPLAEWASDLLAPAAMARYGVLDPGEVAAAWSRFRSGQGTDATSVWAILMLQAWCARWL
jgi:asparagine synthase (glutamine-hydrolysing)